MTDQLDLFGALEEVCTVPTSLLGVPAPMPGDAVCVRSRTTNERGS